MNDKERDNLMFDIDKKAKEIIVLKQENEKLMERIKYLERRLDYYSEKDIVRGIHY